MTFGDDDEQPEPRDYGPLGLALLMGFVAGYLVAAMVLRVSQ